MLALDALGVLLRDAGLAPEIDANVRATVWLKLVNNAGLNPTSVLRGMTIKPMLADPDARAEVRGMMTETLRVGQAMGVVSTVDVDERIAYAARLDDVKTSMLQDYERGRPSSSIQFWAQSLSSAIDMACPSRNCALPTNAFAL